MRAPSSAKEDAAEKSQNVLLAMIGPIMGGMMIFYAFFTGTSTAESILREEDERTLPLHIEYNAFQSIRNLQLLRMLLRAL